MELAAESCFVSLLLQGAQAIQNTPQEEFSSSDSLASPVKGTRQTLELSLGRALLPLEEFQSLLQLLKLLCAKR
jgi:hypothetical protein